jgi:hypothetical protein
MESSQFQPESESKILESSQFQNLESESESSQFQWNRNRGFSWFWNRNSIPSINSRKKNKFHKQLGTIVCKSKWDSFWVNYPFHRQKCLHPPKFPQKFPKLSQFLGKNKKHSSDLLDFLWVSKCRKVLSFCHIFIITIISFIVRKSIICG